MKTKKQKFVIIDGNALLHRAWHALPPLTTQKGEVVNAVYGFMVVFLKMLNEIKPDYLAVAWDRREPTFRHKIFKEYKAQREKQPDELYQQIDRIKQLLSVFNVPSFEKAGYEADDIIATLVNLTPKENIQDIIVTGDLDALQLIDSDTEVYTLRRGVIDTVIYDKEAVQKRYGLSPQQLVDFKALRGDPSDNIPGVPGVGEKTALDLVKTFGSLDGLYRAIDRKDSKINKIKERVRKLLIKYREQTFLNKKLVSVVRDVPVKFSLSDCTVKGWDRDKIIELFKELEFKSLIQRIPAFWGKRSTFVNKRKKNKRKYILVDSDKKFEKFFSKLKGQDFFAIDTETTGLDPFRVKLLGISFCWKEGEAYYVVFNEKWIAKLKPILESRRVKKCGHHIKYDLEVLSKYDIDLNGVVFDTMIAAYLLNPGNRSYGLDSLAFNYFGYQMQSIEELIGPKGRKQLSMDQVPVEKVSWYACEDADYTFRLKNKLEALLRENNLIKLFNEIEMPLIPVLQEMETNGVKIDQKFLDRINIKVSRDLKKLEARIYKLAGTKFNISSPIQLKEVLFKKLKISTEGIKKVKTGFSTAASELEKLRERHPIITLLFEYRELSKLKSTYLEALPKLINPISKRVHTSFNQTITATGRLSSSNPNLQNIPIRTDLGKEIRKAFIAEKGYKILSADYSQIELRIIASLANDKKMIESFRRGEDIHARTAAEINNCKLKDVTYQMRRTAKVVNFGIIYGMSVFGLAQAAGISRDEAKEFMEKYFRLHHNIKNYLEKMIEQAHKRGYVETLFGRRRYLPEINSNVSQLRNAAERMAVNMPIQGTAADLMKLAMIRIFKICQEYNQNENVKPIKLILQVHDELVFEIKKELIEEIAPKLSEIMENVIKLKVPIKVHMKAGDNWGEMKEITFSS